MPRTRGEDFDFHRTGPPPPVAGDATPAVARYFYVLADDHIVKEFCVAGAVGPQRVETLAPDGTPERWPSSHRGDLLVFTPPDGYAGAQGLVYAWDRRLQRAEPMGRGELERRALGNRVSVAL